MSDELVGETLAGIDERLVLAPMAGHFVPMDAYEPPRSLASIVGHGDSVGRVTNVGNACEVVSNFTGWLMGYLVLPGERVRVGQPVAWVRSSPVRLPP
jgi:biotin carboxyl carrier protein